MTQDWGLAAPDAPAESTATHVPLVLTVVPRLVPEVEPSKLNGGTDVTLVDDGSSSKIGLSRNVHVCRV